MSDETGPRSGVRKIPDSGAVIWEKADRDTPELYEFGPFRLDLAERRVMRGNEKVELTSKAFDTLVLLVRNSGHLLEKERFFSTLWPDSFVEEGSLSNNIFLLRRALGEDPVFIETVPRRGYRFVGAVRQLPPTIITEPPPKASIPPEETPRPRRSSGLAILAACCACVLVALAAVVAYRWHWQPGPQEQAALTAVPFTALPGRATSPAFSPDGSRIVFAWNGDPAPGTKDFDLYVKALGSETLLRLTRHPSEWISPAWSPDGTQIAFHRIDGADTGIYVVPALGGPERKLRSTRIPLGPFSIVIGPNSIISWSPDGKWIAFADVVPGEDHASIYLLSPETLETRQLPIGPMCGREGLPAFSHNGEHLAYCCFRRENDGVALYSLPIPGGQPKMISSFRNFPNGLTWSADDKKLIYGLDQPTDRSLDRSLGEVTVANGSVKRLVFAGSASLPTVSPKGDKLAFSSSSNSQNIWRRDLLHPESPPVEFIPSSRVQWDAQYSPDGKRIAFASYRSGLPGVWISNEDGSNLVQISDPAQPSGSPQWSPDGNKIAFDILQITPDRALSGDSWEIYVADVAERKPRKLVTNISAVIRPHWSRDGKWIYFSSREPGRMGVYRCPASGGDAIALSKDIDGSSPQESFDGKTLYFASHEVKSTLKKVALPGQPGTESEVDGLPRLRVYSVWSLSPTGIYFVPAEAPRSLRYFDFASERIRSIFEVDKDFGSGLSVSPDGRWLLYSQIGDASGDIMLVDHFH